MTAFDFGHSPSSAAVMRLESSSRVPDEDISSASGLGPILRTVACTAKDRMAKCTVEPLLWSGRISYAKSACVYRYVSPGVNARLQLSPTRLSTHRVVVTNQKKMPRSRRPPWPGEHSTLAGHVI
jgi:hypothetical protein